MSAVLGMVMPAGQQIGTGEAVLFWVLAPLVVLAALGLLFIRKAVHAAIMVAFVMICLAVMYAAQDAMFLFAAQIVVYTGAIMMLFLFVLMLVGVDTADSFKESVTGQRWIGMLGGLALLFFLIAAVVGIDISFNQAGILQMTGWNAPPAMGLEAANADTNPTAVAREVFGPYVFTFLTVGTLLVIAAVGAIVLTHTERLTPKRTQRERSVERVRSGQVTPLPSPGVFARSNRVDTPALLPDGSPADASVSRVLRARGQDHSPTSLVAKTSRIVDEIEGHTPDELDSDGLDEKEAADTGTGSTGDAGIDSGSPITGPTAGGAARGSDAEDAR